MALPGFLQTILDMIIPNPLGPATAQLSAGSKSLASVEESLKKAVKDICDVLAAVSSPEDVKSIAPTGGDAKEALFTALWKDPAAGKNLLLSKLDVDVNGVTIRKTATGSLKTFAGLDEAILGGLSNIAEGLASTAQAIADSASDPVKAASVAARAKGTKENLESAKSNGEKLKEQTKNWVGLLRSLTASDG